MIPFLMYYLSFIETIKRNEINLWWVKVSCILILQLKRASESTLFMKALLLPFIVAWTYTSSYVLPREPLQHIWPPDRQQGTSQCCGYSKNTWSHTIKMEHSINWQRKGSLNIINQDHMCKKLHDGQSLKWYFPFIELLLLSLNMQQSVLDAPPWDCTEHYLFWQC